MNTTLTDPAKAATAKKLIVALSIVIPLVVAILFKVKINGFDLSVLPSVYATINGITAIVLLSALLAVKKKKFELHRMLIRMALTLSLLFLLLYVAYHMTSDSTVYGDSNHTGDVDILEKIKIKSTALIYYILLISHIVLSIAVIPLVLFTYLFAWQGNFEKHKRFTRYAFPIWLYVAVTGVIVYFMISPYYS